jgi:hypothetical protein
VRRESLVSPSASRLDDRAAVESAAAVICTLADARFYLGLVALLNSLHLTGHSDVPVVVLDGGLTPDQRATVEPFVTLKRRPHGAKTVTALAKVDVASLELPGVVFVIDADCIVTGSLRDIFRLAAAGRICAVRDDAAPGSERRFEEWERLFALRSQVRRGGTYVNAGALCLSNDHWPHLLSRWAEITERLPPGRYVQGRSDTNPIWAADQDVLNAILMSEVPASALEVLPSGTMAYAQSRDARVSDLDTLNVTAMGRASTIAHFSLGPKPWSPGGWKRVGREPLLPLFTRCLVGQGLPLRPDPASVPWWLRSSTAADAFRGAVGVRNDVSQLVFRLLWDVYDNLPEPSRARLRKLRARDVPTISTDASWALPATTAASDDPPDAEVEARSSEQIRHVVDPGAACL